MSTNEWVAIIGSILIILASWLAWWWLRHREYRKQNNTKMFVANGRICNIPGCFGEDPNCGYRPKKDEQPLITMAKLDEWRKPKPLDLLSLANNSAHPWAKHDMKFKKKFFRLEDGIVLKFRCLYCDLEVVIKSRDFWGNPPAQVPSSIIRSDKIVLLPEHMQPVSGPHQYGVDHGVLYTPQDGAMRLGEFKQPKTDRSDDVTSQLMAYAETIKQDTTIAIDKIESDLGPEIPPWSPYYARRLTPDELEERRLMPKTDKNLRAAAAAVGPNPDREWRQNNYPFPDDLLGLYEQDAEGVWHPTEKGKRYAPPDRSWAKQERLDADIEEQVNKARNPSE